MNENVNILVVDDDVNIGHLIKLYLEKEGFSVSIALRGDEAVQTFKNGSFQLIILDVMLPGLDGWDVCREIRKISDVPIIMLTAKGETFDKVLGLELGADDYMVKPFDPKELVARIKAMRRRAVPKSQSGNILEFDNLVVNMNTYSVEYFGNPMELPPKEMELLFFLAKHNNNVFTREQLLEQVWDFDYFGDSRTVDVHIRNLREKLGKAGNLIKNVRGIGYKLEE